MSTFLYELGRTCFRFHRRVLLVWLGVLAVVGILAVGLGGTYRDAFEIPGAPSQIALQKLQMTFPAAAAESATAIIIAPEGQRVDDATLRAGIEKGLATFADVPVVDVVTSPWNEYISGLVSDDGRAALIQLQLTGADFTDITDADRADLVAAAATVEDALPEGTTVNMGGQAFAIEVPGLSATEAVGLLVAMVVLVVTLGSMVAAGVPLLTSILGVGITVGLMTFAAGLTTVNSTTPMLAVMLGLAVGIDYALFVLSRHRDQLKLGMELEESAARANATAGSAVVFAGLTVVIALIGLSVANIPFLTVMGMFAALGVAIA
ncbi:MAG TPA: MMPL family transporter, partial [Propionibacteriaceae bacterium]|nr:MMPL family transporter [Propionibacteriaceae bacterium]